MYITRKKYKFKRRLMKIMYWALNRWYKRLSFLKIIRYHKKKGVFTTREELRRCGAARRIQHHYRLWRREKLIKAKYSVLLQTMYRMFYTQKNLLPVQQLFSKPNEHFFIMTQKSMEKLKLKGSLLPNTSFNLS